MKKRIIHRKSRSYTAVLIILVAGVLALAVWGAFLLENRINRRIDLNLHPQKFCDEVSAASSAYNVPPDVIYAVILTESGFDKDAESHSGAKGLMQLMPDTFDWIAWRLGEVSNRDLIFEPALNIRYGTYLLSYLYKEFNDWDLVYAAYNAGDTRVKEWLNDSTVSENGKLVHIPYSETASYVKKVGSAREAYLRLYYETEAVS